MVLGSSAPILINGFHVFTFVLYTFINFKTCSNEVAELGVSRNGINITTFEPQRQTIANLK